MGFRQSDEQLEGLLKDSARVFTKEAQAVATAEHLKKVQRLALAEMQSSSEGESVALFSLELLRETIFVFRPVLLVAPVLIALFLFVQNRQTPNEQIASELLELPEETILAGALDLGLPLVELEDLEQDGEELLGFETEYLVLSIDENEEGVNDYEHEEGLAT